jgi:hypothetical protein
LNINKIDNESLARIGATCLLQLVMTNGFKFDGEMWTLCCDKFQLILDKNIPSELLSTPAPLASSIGGNQHPSQQSPQEEKETLESDAGASSNVTATEEDSNAQQANKQPKLPSNQGNQQGKIATPSKNLQSNSDATKGQNQNREDQGQSRIH